MVWLVHHFKNQVLQGIDGVICYLDEIMIQEQGTETHEKPGISAKKDWNAITGANKEKRAFLQHCVSYLGHVTDAEGIHAMQEKCEAIVVAVGPILTSPLSH